MRFFSKQNNWEFDNKRLYICPPHLLWHMWPYYMKNYTKVNKRVLIKRVAHTSQSRHVSDTVDNAQRRVQNLLRTSCIKSYRKWFIPGRVFNKRKWEFLATKFISNKKRQVQNADKVDNHVFRMSRLDIFCSKCRQIKQEFTSNQHYCKLWRHALCTYTINTNTERIMITVECIQWHAQACNTTITFS